MSDVAQTSDPLDNVLVLKQAVRRLEYKMSDSFRYFSEARSSLLRRMNSLQGSTRNFPSEILCHIFLLASEDCKTYPGHQTFIKLGLGRVCSLWRQIALSTPQLWSSLTLFINGRLAKGTQNPLNLLQFHLDHVGRIPFSLEFLFDGYNHSDLSVLSRSLSSPLRQEGFRKVHILKFVGVPLEWLSSLPEFPEIEELWVSKGVRLSSPRTVLEMLPIHSGRLYRLELHDTRVLPNTWCVHQLGLTHVSLSRVPVTLCISLLANCPNLVRFESTYPLVAAGGLGTAVAGGPVTLRQLEYFNWAHPERLTSVQDLALMGFYRRLDFPALRILHWWGNRNVHLNVNALRALLPNLPSTISSLNVHFVLEWPILLIQDLFQQIPNVQNLYFYGCDSVTVINSIISLGRWSKNAKHQGVFLPHLKFISFGEFRNLLPDDEVIMTKYLINSLCNRCKVLDTEFSVELSGLEGRWVGVARKANRLLRKEGIDVEVWAGGKVERLLE